MQPKSDEQIIEGILAHDSDTLRYLYQTMFGQIKTFVSKNNGSTEEAKDIFQDGLLALYQNLYQNKYQKENATRLTSYFYQICKFKWYSVLRSSYKRKTVGSEDVQLSDQYDHGFEADNAEWDKITVVRQAMAQLAQPCQELLTAFYYKEQSMKEIAIGLGQQTNSVKNAKYRCMQKLKGLLKSGQHGS